MVIHWIKRLLKLLPTVLVLTFIIFPVILVIWMSFFSQKMIVFPPKGYTLEWYSALAQKKNFASAALMSVRIGFISSALGIVLGTLACIGLRQRSFRGKNLMETIFLAPLSVPTIVSGIAIYALLTVVGNRVGMKLVPNTFVLVLGHTIITLPWAVRLISAGFAGVDPALEEAALNLGASRVTAYLKVILPQIKPSMVTAAIFS